MPLESASYLSQLEVANPASNDALAQADDHLRLIKSVLKNTFPKLDGAVNATPAQLNDVGALRTDVDAMKTGKVSSSGGEMTGTLTIKTGDMDVTAGKVKEAGQPLIPRGSIIMWSGTTAPGGWALCNGQVVSGLQTPDLRDRFIVATGGAYVLGQKGGNNVTAAVSNSAGAHGHIVSVEGGHSHGGSTASHVLTVDQMPAHDHGVNSGTNIGKVGSGHMIPGIGQPLLDNQLFYGQGGNQGHSHGINADGAHGHGVSIEGAHTHTVEVDTRSPYYALAFIIKL